MAEKKGGLKGFFGEFKQFITRGNVMDMAVGVIVGGAFTAIITALSDHILKPVINWLLALIFGKNSLTEIYTFLKPFLSSLRTAFSDVRHELKGSLVYAPYQ